MPQGSLKTRCSRWRAKAIAVVVALACCFAAAARPAAAEPPLVFDEEQAEGHSPSCDCSGPCDHQSRPFFTIRDRVTFGAEYLLLRPTFGNDTALYQTTTTGGTQLANTGVNYQFGYSSGVRGFLGYRLSDEWLVRFAYLSIGATDGVSGESTGNWIGGNGTGFIGPFDTIATVAGQSITSRVNVALNVYDLELAGRFGAATCEADGSPSPWETAAAAGLRFADVAIDSNVFNDQSALGQLNQVFLTTSSGFQGVGPRVALQGRRYLGPGRTWSVFGCGAAALLVGTYDQADVRTRRRDEGGGVFSTNVQRQADRGTLVVPNIDISLGLSWQLARRTSLSAGWMLMYWGEVGYSEGISTATAAPSPRPDLVPVSNSSLSYDGAFFRLTHQF